MYIADAKKKAREKQKQIRHPTQLGLSF